MAVSVSIQSTFFYRFCLLYLSGGGTNGAKGRVGAWGPRILPGNGNVPDRPQLSELLLLLLALFDGAVVGEPIYFKSIYL